MRRSLDPTRVQWILLLNVVVLLLHQFEEYAWPGGEPWILRPLKQIRPHCVTVRVRS